MERRRHIRTLMFLTPLKTSSLVMLYHVLILSVFKIILK